MAKTSALRMTIGLVVIAATSAAFAQEAPDPLADRSFLVVDGAAQGCSIGFTTVPPGADPLYMHLSVDVANTCPYSHLWPFE
jgi:hypothetical protein